MKWVLLFTLVAHLAVGQAPHQTKLKKIHGISFVASRDVPHSDTIKSVEVTHANWLCMMPFGFARPNDPKVHFNSTRQWYGETVEGIAKGTRKARELGYSVAIKPQLWLLGGQFTGDWAFSNEADWKVAEDSYRDYILAFAEVAQREGAEMLIIGTELDSFATARPEFWFGLIKDARALYSGQLTYAANRDAYAGIPYWEELDYIGIDAYFPVSNIETPTAEEVRVSREEQYRPLHRFSRVHNLKILFTEYGYRSVVGGLVKPWDSHSGEDYDIATQCNGYIGLYNAVWQQDSFAGGFLWKWFDRPESVGGHGHTGYTPQNKPSLEVIRDYFGNAQSH